MTILNYNVAAQRAATTMTRNDKVINTAMSRLSTGIKLNQAEDGPATIGVYKGLQVQGVTTRAAIENINNGISYLRTVDDAGAAIETLLIRMKELAVIAQSGTTDATQKAALDSEYRALGLQWNRIVADTKWNGTAVMAKTTLEIGVGQGAAVSMALLNWASTETTAANSVFGFSAAAAANNGTAGTNAFDFTTATGPTNDHLTGTTTQNSVAMAKVTDALEELGKERARLGAYINSLKASADSLVDLADRYESNASAIGDANYASESAKLATAQIVSQAATAMLAQANAQKGTVLSLLK
jgi:flagellin